jgi:CRP-like cAMP-binding protein
MYIQTGAIKLSVVSRTGREAVVAVLGHGDFFGEECLAGQASRTGKATALVPSVILLVRKAMMIRLLHERRAMSDRFISHMLARNIRAQIELADQVFDSSEKRVARALLLLAGYGTDDPPARVLPNISQDALARMAGLTRSRVNVFLNRFKKLGFIEYDGDVAINSALLSFVLQD